MFKNKVYKKKQAKQRIRRRVRKKINGTKDKPRIHVSRSNRYIYIQVVDDINGKVLTSASTLEKDFREKQDNTKNMKASQTLAKTMAERLKKNKIKNIVFDRGHYPYQGRIKALAESLRKSGINF
ncbi:MAG: 50S ribosomal protein L18 [Candidatus Aminicenantes bacterium]|nr:50S ribosomal protein L18 [Candidatus Aminicenantes bacterium]